MKLLLMRFTLLLGFFLLATAVDVCQLRLILNDAGQDGWEDNYVTGTANGVAINFNALDTSVSATDGKATLLEKAIGSFKFEIPAGASVTINYFGSKAQYAHENSWIVELYDIYNPFGSVVLSKSTQKVDGDYLVPYDDPIVNVVCGPKPKPVTALRVQAGDWADVSSINWAKDPSHDDTVVFVVTYVRSDTPDTINYLGYTKDAHFDAILPTGLKLTVTVEALNKYGPSTVTSTKEITAAEYQTRRLFLRLYDSDGLGWGVNDGGVKVTLNNVDFLTATFDCPAGINCYSHDVILEIPTGVHWTVQTQLLAPTKGVEDCSYAIFREDGISLFETGQDAFGPVTPNGAIDIFFDAGCLTADPWGDCVANNGVCGAGTQARRVYTSVSDTDCAISLEKQNCTVPCPVDCVGAWGDWSSCNPSCGVGYKSRTYSVISSAADGGADCPQPHGHKDTVQCPDLPSCPQLCTYMLEGFDYEQDGWGDSYLEVVTADKDTPQVLTMKTYTIDPTFTDTSRKLFFAATRGTTVLLRWHPVITDTHNAEEASFSVSPMVGDVVLKGRDVLQNPPGLQLQTAPANESSFVASCADCSAATADVCKGLHRRQCEFAQVGDNVCGACLEGYKNADNPDSGNTPCIDIDECAAANPCLLKNAQCKNTDGAFICYCTDPDVPTDDPCPETLSAPTSFLETGMMAKSMWTDTLPPSSSKCPAQITRKEWSEMSEGEKGNWRDAVKAMYTYTFSQTLDDGRKVTMNFWQWTRILHRLVSISGAADNVHGTTWFLPWHRQFLRDLELFIRAQTGTCIFLPFYDSTRLWTAGEAAWNDLFRNDMLCKAQAGYILKADSGCALKDIPGCNTSFESYDECTDPYWNSLYRDRGMPAITKKTGNQWNAQMELAPGYLVGGPSNYWTILQMKDYGSFNTNIETQHAGFHVAVGGWMGGLLTAAGDPSFFMHHCTVDAIWAMWQACFGLSTNVASNAKVWASGGGGYNDPMPRIHNVKPIDVYSIYDLGYRYSFEFANNLRAAFAGSGNGAETFCTSLGKTESTWFDDGSSTTAGPTSKPTTTAKPSPTTTAKPTTKPTTAKPTAAPPTTTAKPTTKPTTAKPTSGPTSGPIYTTAAPTWTIPGWVTLTPPQVASTMDVYDGNGWLFVPNGGDRSNQAGYYVNPGRYQDFRGAPNSFLETSTGIRVIGAAAEAPYPEAYKGFYKRADNNTNTTDLYSSHGCGKKHKSRKRKGGQNKEVKAWKKLRKAYKDELEKTGDEQLAVEAFVRIECTLFPHDTEVLWTDDMIKKMQREKVCAAGGCHDPCYRLTKGKNAAKRNKKYLKKHGKWPKDYTASLNQTEGTVPTTISLLEEVEINPQRSRFNNFLEMDIPLPPPTRTNPTFRLKERIRSHQEALNPLR